MHAVDISRNGEVPAFPILVQLYLISSDFFQMVGESFHISFAYFTHRLKKIPSLSPDLEPLGQVEEYGEEDEGGLVELDVLLRQEVGGAQLAVVADADVALEAVIQRR